MMKFSARSRCMKASVVDAISLTFVLGALCPATAAGGPLFSAPFLSFDAANGPFSVAIGDGSPQTISVAFRCYWETGTGRSLGRPPTGRAVVLSPW